LPLPFLVAAVAEAPTQSSKPLPLRVHGHALLVLLVLSIWLWLVGVGVVASGQAVVVQVALEPELAWLFLLQAAMATAITPLLLAVAEQVERLAVGMGSQDQILFFQQ
jgi:hypothetical protein